MKVILFGATGFLGYHVAREFLAHQDFNDVLVMHRTNSDLSALKSLSGPLSFEVTDLFNFPSAQRGDVVINMIGDTHISPLNHQRQFEVNVNLAERIAKFSKNMGARLIQTSSISAYGFHDDMITERTPSTALSSGVNYLRTKYLGEQAVRAVEGLDYVFINPAAIIGSHDKHNWSQLVKMVKTGTLPGVPPGSGSYCHVGEVAKAHVKAIDSGRTGENYLLGSEEIPFSKVIEIICDILQVENNFKLLPAFLLRSLGRFNDLKTRLTGKEQDLCYEKSLLITKRTCASSEKSKRELGYKDNVPVKLMFEECIEWLEKNSC